MTPATTARFILTCLALALVPALASADTDLEISGIHGEGPGGRISITSFSFGVSASYSANGGSGGSSASPPTFSEISFSRPTDSASAAFEKAVSTGKSLGKAKFSFTTNSGRKPATYLTYELSSVQVTGFSISSGGDRPSESISIRFSKIESSAWPVNPDGSLGSPTTWCYDLKSQQSC